MERSSLNNTRCYAAIGKFVLKWPFLLGKVDTALIRRSIATFFVIFSAIASSEQLSGNTIKCHGFKVELSMSLLSFWSASTARIKSYIACTASWFFALIYMVLLSADCFSTYADRLYKHFKASSSTMAFPIHWSQVFKEEFNNDYCWTQGLFTNRYAYGQTLDTLPAPGIVPCLRWVAE